MTKEEYNTAHGLIQTLVEDDDSEQLGVIAKRLLLAVYNDGVRWDEMEKYTSQQRKDIDSEATKFRLEVKGIK